ncbi:hypothetical protein [Bradyrhizobium valentinum]|uniref:Uncharacterized protein n=1 Tax=Bradyrhizobium valentinum TaxID=1518501 RepID=A0A0R3LY20_9BRAD|nr:hypothetical protein [Bradyrhizobium valentinum]KRQ93673.1 hypothetical protein CQ10_35380 [Bradyrhizobium valentinum]KRR12872.1 hypothetical protein CP49_16745 [Bradyrhizobium valentinum]
MRAVGRVAIVAASLGSVLAALLAWSGLPQNAAATATAPVWTEIAWPFPSDPFGKGKAFRCKAADCGAEVNLYLRAKIGFCNCTTGVADDDDVDRMGDIVLVGDVLPLGTSRPVRIASMEGRSRAYTLNARNPLGKTAISVVFRERCDMIAATAVLGHDRPAAIEPSVIEFLNGSTVMRWAEVTLGL